jgi:possible resolvase
MSNNTLYLYAKTDIDLSVFDDIILRFNNKYTELDITIENRRSFRDLDKLLQRLNKNDVLLINDLSDIGLKQTDLIKYLDYIVYNNIILIIQNIDTTHDDNIDINKAVLSTLKQYIVSNNNIINFSNKSSVGRSKIIFPDNWEDLYNSWINHEITSKEFINKSGLKKATFYNLLGEYKHIQELNLEYINKYRLA